MHTVGPKIAVTAKFSITGLCFQKFHIFKFSIEIVFRHHAKFPEKLWCGSFDTYLLLFKARNWGQNTFFGNCVYLWFHTTMYFDYYVLWYPGHILKLHFLTSLCNSSFYTILLKTWSFSLFFCPFSHISSLSLSCSEYALVPYQLSSHIKQFQFGQCSA